MSDPDRCARCGGAMEAGFLIDRGDYDWQKQALWASGEPKSSWWRSTAVQSGERTMAVTTWRCSRCGRLELFAQPGA